jgi:single-strand DNA-binding protein
MLNNVILIGRLTRDPELNYTQNGTAVGKFTLAVQRKFNKDEADFIDIVVWRGLAENCANYLAKGRLVAVEGRIQTRTYETKEGQKRKAFEVVADDVRFIGSGGKDNNGSTSTEDWSDLGKEVNLDDIKSDKDEIPF